MRISDEMTYGMLTFNILSNQRAVYEIQQQLATGRRINRPSDDPGTFDIIKRLHADTSQVLQFARNAERVEHDMLTVDSILQTMIGIFQRASELAVSAGDGTAPPSDRVAKAGEVNQLLEELLGLANFSDGGRYIFAGLRTDTKAYTDDSAVSADGLIHTITYQGSREIRDVEIGKEIYIEANIPGSNTTGANAVFQTGEIDLFNTLIQFRDRLLAGENVAEPEVFAPGDVDALADTLTLNNVYRTGSMVEFSTDGTLPGGILADTCYYAIETGVPGRIQVAASLADARAWIAIDITDTGAGTHTIHQESLNELNASLDHIINTLTTVGAREERLRANREILIQREDRLRSTLEQEESIDVAKMVIDLSRTQLAYQAALQAAAGILNRNTLVNWI